jgi:hypothetical protein
MVTIPAIGPQPVSCCQVHRLPDGRLRAEKETLTLSLPYSTVPHNCSSEFYFAFVSITLDRLCGLVVRVLGYRSGGPGSIPGTTRKKSSGSGTESTQPREYNWGATWQKSSGYCLENREYGRKHPSRWPRGTLYPQKLAITSPTSSGRSIVIIRSRNQATEFFFFQSLWSDTCWPSHPSAKPSGDFPTSPVLTFVVVILVPSYSVQSRLSAGGRSTLSLGSHLFRTCRELRMNACTMFYMHSCVCLSSNNAQLHGSVGGWCALCLKWEWTWDVYIKEQHVKPLYDTTSTPWYVP